IVGTSTFRSHVQPESRGVATRCARPAANTSTAVIPATPNAAPVNAERTGTDDSPRPASKAIRRPLVAAGRIPDRAASSTIGECVARAFGLDAERLHAERLGVTEYRSRLRYDARHVGRARARPHP